MISQEQIQQALKLHKLINKSSTLASAPRTKKGSVQSAKKTDSKRTTKKSSKDLTGSIPTLHTIDHSVNDSKPILIEHPRETHVTHVKVDKCEEHPGEPLQFYSFLHNKALCPSCLLSGDYAGSETVSIKKASEMIKHKLSDLVIEIEGKLDTYELYSKKLANRKEELKDIVSGYKREVSSNIAQLISKLQAKEKELVEELDQVQEAKLQDLIQASQRLRTNEDQIRMKKSDLARHLKDFGGTDLCTYYSKQQQSIQNCLHDEGSLALHEAKIIAETNVSLHERVNLERFKECLRNNNAEIDMMTTYQLEPLNEAPKLSVRLRSPEKETRHIRSPEKETRNGSDKEYMLTQKPFHERGKDHRLSSDLPPWSKQELLASSSKRPIHEMTPQETRSRFNFKDRPQGIDDILLNGYKRIQEMKAISPSLPATTKSKATGDVLGVSELLGHSSTKRLGSSGLGAQITSSKSESKYRNLFSETKFTGRENMVSSQKGTPHRGYEFSRLSLRDGKIH